MHHGNGTQACFYDRADVLTVSLHMAHGAWGRSHPQTGAPDEIGVGAGEGFNVNVELPRRLRDRAYTALSEVVAPLLDKLRPRPARRRLRPGRQRLRPRGPPQRHDGRLLRHRSAVPRSGRSPQRWQGRPRAGGRLRAARMPPTACTRRSRACSASRRCSPTRSPTYPTTPHAVTRRSDAASTRWSPVWGPLRQGSHTST